MPRRGGAVEQAPRSGGLFCSVLAGSLRTVAVLAVETFLVKYHVYLCIQIVRDAFYKQVAVTS